MTGNGNTAGEKSRVGAFEGFRCLFSGLRMVYVTHRGLARFYLIPMILALVITVAAWVLFYQYSDDIVRWVWSEPDGDAWWGLLHFLWRFVSFAVFLASAALTALSSVFLFSLLTVTVNDLFSERIEGILGTWTPREFSIRFLIADFGNTLRFEAARFFLKLAWLVPLFLLSLVIPVIGHLVYLIVGGYFLCKYTGMDYIDWCAARRGRTWKERLLYAKKHRAAVAGFGFGVVLSFMVPLLFVFVWPGAVAGGTMLFLKLEGGRSSSPARRS